MKNSQIDNKYLHCICFVLLLACNNPETKSVLMKPMESVPDDTVKNQSQINTIIPQKANPDSSMKSLWKVKSIKTRSKQPQMSLIDGIYDTQLNGKPVLIQMDLPEQIWTNNPDTIRKYIKAFYIGQSDRFPRSIADDFERGISHERISYPRLNYHVELFENEFANKPYRFLGY